MENRRSFENKFFKDAQANIVALLDNAGATVVKYRYDAWGKCTIVSDNSGINIATINPFRYRSYYYDTETKLYYLQSRYYNPEVGRFVNADNAEILFNVSKTVDFNLYAYCGNDCVNEKGLFFQRKKLILNNWDMI